MAFMFAICLIAANIQKQGIIASVTQVRIGVIVDKDTEQGSLLAAVGQMHDFPTDWNRGKGAAGESSVVWIPLNSSSTTDATSGVCRALDFGVKALVSVVRCAQKRVVSAMTETFQIPHLSVDLNPCPSITPEEFTIHLSTMYQNIGTLLVDITRATGCKEVAFITDGVFSTVQSVRQSVIAQLSVNGIRTVLVSLFQNRVSDSNEIPGHIIVIAGWEQLQMILRREENFKWRRNYHVWAFITDLSDPQLIGQLLKLYDNINVVLVKPQSVSLSTNCCLPGLRSGKALTLLEIHLSEAVHRLQRAFNFVDDASLLNHHEPFCSVQQPIPFAGGVQLLKYLRLVSNKESGLRDDQKSPGEFHLFALRAGPARHMTCVGHWSESTRLTLRNTSSINSFLANDEADFHGVTLRVAAHENSYPYVGRIGSGNGSYQGITIDILNDLAIRLNFRYVLIESRGDYGVKIGNGSWSGMIGMAARREVDLAASPMTMTRERSEVVDFTTPFMQDSLGIITPRPKEKTNLFQLISPFSKQVWLSLLALFLLASVMTASIVVTTRYPSSSTCRDGSEKQSVQDNILLLISAFCQQGPTFHPSSVSARCFLSFWFVFTILTMAMYTANLAAVLTESTPLRPINSLRDLADQTEFGILVRPGTSIWDLFKLSTVPLYKQIGERMKESTSLNGLKVSTVVKDGRYCYISERSHLRFMVAMACGQIRLADERFRGYSLAFALPKGSPHKHAIDVKIQQMVESGIIDAWKKKWFAPSVNCSHYKGTLSPMRLGLDRIGGVTILYSGLIVTAVLVLLAERTYYKLAKK